MSEVFLNESDPFLPTLRDTLAVVNAKEALKRYHLHVVDRINAESCELLARLNEARKQRDDFSLLLKEAKKLLREQMDENIKLKEKIAKMERR